MGLILSAFFAFTFALAEPGYVAIGGHDDVQVYAVQNTNKIQLAAVGEIDAPPARVQAALLDYANAPRIVSHLAASNVLSRNDHELVVYQHLKLPIIKDRDYTLRVTWNADDARGLQFSIDPSQGPAPSKKLVRMPILSGRWDLAPIHNGRATRAVYHVELDFGGSVGKGSVRNGAAKDLPNIFVGLRRVTGEHTDVALLSQ